MKGMQHVREYKGLPPNVRFGCVAVIACGANNARYGNGAYDPRKAGRVAGRD